VLHKGDLVWRKVGEARRCRNEGKLAPSWDNPYRIADTLQNGAYKLQELSDKLIPNVEHNPCKYVL